MWRILLGLMLPVAALAQTADSEQVSRLSVDLTGDGNAEHLVLTRGDFLTLQIKTAAGTVFAPDIAWPGALMVAGITYTGYDTLDLDQRVSCDVNLLSGRGILEKGDTRREIRSPVPALKISDWDEMKVVEICEL